MSAPDAAVLRGLTSAQFALLAILYTRHGVIYLRDEQAQVAIEMAATNYIALGPTEGGAVSAVITAEGRTYLDALLAQATATDGAAHADA